MDQWDPRDQAENRSFYGKPGLISFILVIGFVLYVFFG